MEKHKSTLSWEELKEFQATEIDRIDGPNNAYSSLRLFRKPEANAKVILYRDHHAWCPYCQKIWLWLEFKKVPYKIGKVTMRCYGQKEPWYLNLVPSGILPAIKINSKIITESDEIILELEREFGPLGKSLKDSGNHDLRVLERNLFRAWCNWLCNPSIAFSQESRRKERFLEIASELESKLKKATNTWLDPLMEVGENKSMPGVGDIIFIPYLERMNASLSYYKGFCLRSYFPSIHQWFQSLESFEEYLGTQGDFHTHAHDLPPQMGGCWKDSSEKQRVISQEINNGNGFGEYETSQNSETKGIYTSHPKAIALSRVIKHRENIIKVNPIKEYGFDQPIRAALTKMITSEDCMPNKGSAYGLRYLRDRISVPRDMPILSARALRQALEATAQLDGAEEGPPIHFKNRYDQNPLPFLQK